MANNSGYGVLVDDETQRRLQRDAAQYFGLNGSPAKPVAPVYSAVYGVGATPPAVVAAAQASALQRQQTKAAQPVAAPQPKQDPTPVVTSAPAPAEPQRPGIPLTSAATAFRSDPAGTIYKTGDSTSGRAGFANRTYTINGAAGQASGIAPTGRIGGFAGASTDAEAARNQQAAVAQATAAQTNIARMNMAADAERDLRATKLGISRAVLDQMEGRSGGSNASSVPEAPQAQTLFDRPGDGFGDAALRRESIMSGLESKDKKTRTSAAAQFAALSTNMDKQNALAAKVYDTQLDYAGKARDAQLGFAKEQGLDRRSAAEIQAQNARTAATIEGDNQRAQINVRAGIAKEQLGNTATDRRESDKLVAKRFEEGSKYLSDATQANGKNPPIIQLADLNRFLADIDVPKLAEGFGISQDDARRIKAGNMTPEEARLMVGQAVSWKNSQPGYFKSFFTEAPTAMSFLTR